MRLIPFKNWLKKLALAILGLHCLGTQAQEKPETDVTTPLHLMKPDYPIPYGIPEQAEVKVVLDRVFNYLNEVTPAKVIDRNTGQEVQNFDKITRDAMLQQGDFRLTSYEWGVTYAGMTLVGEIPGDKRYTDYTETRLKLLADLTAFYRENPDLDVDRRSPVHSVLPACPG
jgi:hypothetical protein